MSKRDRGKYTATFKTAVVLEALGAQDDKRTGPAVRPASHQTGAWKKEFLSGSSTVFEAVVDAACETLKQDRAVLFQQIGKLQVENDLLKKKVLR